MISFEMLILLPVVDFKPNKSEGCSRNQIMQSCYDNELRDRDISADADLVEPVGD